MKRLKEQFVNHLNEDGTSVIYDLEEEQYYQLNEVATTILMNSDKEIKEIIKIIKKEYLIDEPNFEEDIKDFHDHISTVFLK